MQNLRMAENEDNLFARSMADVVPLKPQTRVETARTRPKPIAQFSQSDKNQLLQESLAAPNFNEIETGDILSWHQAGIQKRVVRKLRQGQYAIKDELDLHGLNQAQAKLSTAAFLNQARTQGFSCVRIVHGKGNRSEYGPVLKRAIGGWLVKRKDVLAFASAPSHDGGTGAIYVLLARA